MKDGLNDLRGCVSNEWLNFKNLFVKLFCECELCNQRNTGVRRWRQYRRACNDVYAIVTSGAKFGENPQMHNALTQQQAIKIENDVSDLFESQLGRTRDPVHFK
jgi:hypothetical protein